MSSSIEIRSNLAESTLAKIPEPKFGRIRPSRARSKFSRPRPKVWQVRTMLKFDFVGPDKKSAKLYGIGPMDTSFRKFILNLFYKK